MSHASGSLVDPRGCAGRVGPQHGAVGQVGSLWEF